MKRLTALALGTALALSLATTVAAQPHDRVTLCHATGSESNPFVTITVSASGAYNGHLGNDHQDGEDIIPPFEFKGETYSQNWPEGRAIFENDCEAPEDEVTTTTAPTTTTVPSTTTTAPQVTSTTEAPSTSTTVSEALPTSVERPTELPFTGPVTGLEALLVLATMLVLGGGTLLLIRR